MRLYWPADAQSTTPAPHLGTFGNLAAGHLSCLSSKAMFFRLTRFFRIMRWTAALIVACAMAAVGCGRTARSHDPLARPATPITEDDSVAHAFDTEMAVRLLDRIELDRSLRNRNIRR